MGKGINKFLNMFSLNDEDGYDDDLFDEEDDDEYDDDDEYERKSSFSVSSLFGSRSKHDYDDDDDDEYDDDDDDDFEFLKKKKPAYSDNDSVQRQTQRQSPSSKLVSFNGRSSKNNYNNSRGSTVYVIKPQDFNEAQTVTEYLREGKAIVVNLEGIDLAVAQRVIDFVGGSCFALDGSLQAISSNIFIAAPQAVDVTGDLRNEILNENTVSPDLTKY